MAPRELPEYLRPVPGPGEGPASASAAEASEPEQSSPERRLKGETGLPA